MSEWRFLEYWTEEAQNLTGAWYAWQGPEVQAAFYVRLQLVAATRDWTGLKHVEQLKRRHQELWQIKLKIPKTRSRPVVQYRAVGFVRAMPQDGQPGEFVVILVCRKYYHNTIPHDAFDLALCLNKRFEQNGFGALYDLSLEPVA